MTAPDSENRTVPVSARRKRTTRYLGATVGASYDEWDRSLSLGCVEYEPTFCRLAGKLGASLLADLDAIRVNADLTPAERAAGYDAAITADRRAVQ